MIRSWIIFFTKGGCGRLKKFVHEANKTFVHWIVLRGAMRWKRLLICRIPISGSLLLVRLTLFFGHLLLQGICGTFLGILGCLRQAGRIEERKCRAIRTKIPFPAIQMLLQNLPEREKTLTMKHHQHNCTNTTNTTKHPTTFGAMRVWRRFIRHSSRRPQKVVFVIWTFGKEIVVKEYLTIRDVQ